LELRADELEALRLMDFEGLYQQECALRMGISRTTLSRTVAEARRKVADVLLNGKRLVVAAAEQPAAEASSPSCAESARAASPRAEQDERSGGRRVAWRGRV
jgi:hypothetical protein